MKTGVKVAALGTSNTIGRQTYLSELGKLGFDVKAYGLGGSPSAVGWVFAEDALSSDADYILLDFCVNERTMLVLKCITTKSIRSCVSDLIMSAIEAGKWPIVIILPSLPINAGLKEIRSLYRSICFERGVPFIDVYSILERRRDVEVKSLFRDSSHVNVEMQQVVARLLSANIAGKAAPEPRMTATPAHIYVPINEAANVSAPVVGTSLFSAPCLRLGSDPVQVRLPGDALVRAILLNLTASSGNLIMISDACRVTKRLTNEETKADPSATPIVMALPVEADFNTGGGSVTVAAGVGPYDEWSPHFLREDRPDTVAAIGLYGFVCERLGPTYRRKTEPQGMGCVDLVAAETADA